MSGTLVLVRHGQSEWNLKNLFTGWRDIGLTEQGTREARSAGRKLAERGFKFDIAFTSALSSAPRSPASTSSTRSARATLRRSRTRRSTSATMATCPASTRTMPAPNGARSRCISGAAPTISRRPAEKACGIPARGSGPTTCTTSSRTRCAASTVLVAAHGNSLRALIMALEGMSGDQIVKLELGTGVPMIYRLNADSTLASKEILDGA